MKKKSKNEKECNKILDLREIKIWGVIDENSDKLILPKNLIVEVKGKDIGSQIAGIYVSIIPGEPVRADVSLVPNGKAKR